MAYHLGIDLGTTYTAAAVERDGRVVRVILVPSVLFLEVDGTVVVGDEAQRRGAAEPTRLAREFKRRIGDSTPILLGGAPHSADALTGKLLRWVVERVVAREGGPPASIAVTHPANWGPFKLDLFQQAARQANVGVARFLSEPEAAATSYAATQAVPEGSIIAVYDLGGGTFDAAVLRTRADGFDLLGQPDGVERLGGIDFDVAVFEHVWRSLGTMADGTDPAAVGRLRQACVAAKEALSVASDVSIPVDLPTVQTEVRLTRGEFEAMIRPALAESVTALRRAISSAGVGPEQVAAVLLVGGSSRIPLVAELVTRSLGRPVAVDANPEDAVCFGAALAASRAAAVAAAPPPVTVAPPIVAPAPAPVPVPAPAPTRRGLAAAVVGLVLLLGVAAALIATSGGDDDDDGGDVATQSDRDATSTTDSAAAPIVEATTVPVDRFDAIEDTFLADCIDDQVRSGALSEERAQLFCSCSFAAIANTFEFDEFLDLDEQARTTGEPPAEITEAVAPCVDRF